MKLKLDTEGYVTGYTEYCLDYETAPGVEYTGPVPEDFAVSCSNYRYQDGQLVADADRCARALQKENAAIERQEISNWFSWYDNQCMQYQRSLRLGEAFDQDIAALDQEAKQKQARARELQILLGGSEHGNV